ncbi:MAG: tRNA 2-selenouridine(34) synthase MnmH [Hahellaceae bacterium]|nr:tRNA 2-selenouridine(34) synthase MnmH [Hahellaceae bacterium]MCP5209757.1 tRNA 2-selenouridine(34) synthase MnmH [Hahellaceae bacterium]
MTQRPNTDNYLELFLNDTPMMDVRAPVEFVKGAFPKSTNLPLMDDEERRLIGIRYKESGQESAIELGHELVCGDIKTNRIAKWIEFAKAHPEGYLYCFRGGLRSRTTQQWMKDAGVDYPLVTGGYKAMRRFLIDEIERQSRELKLIIISGRTGTGKTRLLSEFQNHIDLEGIAHHRGSSFGRMLTPQPTQIEFENRIAVALLKARHQKQGPVFLEDESRLIGCCALPLPLKEAMANCPMMVLEEPIEYRIDVVLQDYVIDMTAAYLKRDGETQGWESFSKYLLDSLGRIERRLGGERKAQVEALMREAIRHQQQTNDYTGHREWINAILTNYYDPMYDYQLEKKSHRILSRGDRASLIKEFNQ